MQKNNGIIIYKAVVDVCTLLAFILSYIHIPEQYEYLERIFVLIVIALLIVSMIISICSRNKYTRKRLMRTTKKIMTNSESVVMFGGDLTWAPDYASTITNLTANSKQVDIIFPKTKYESANSQAKLHFDKNIDILKKAGATIYYTDVDTGLRCTLVNVGAFDVNKVDDSEDLKVITSKRVYKNEKNGLRNKYRVNIYGIKKDYEKPLCMLYYKFYDKVKADFKVY